jgi:hypothetical protein
VELIDKVMVYDVSGKLIKEKKKIENTELINAPEQFYRKGLPDKRNNLKKIIY